MLYSGFPIEEAPVPPHAGNLISASPSDCLFTLYKGYHHRIHKIIKGPHWKIPYPFDFD